MDLGIVPLYLTLLLHVLGPYLLDAWYDLLTHIGTYDVSIDLCYRLHL